MHIHAILVEVASGQTTCACVITCVQSMANFACPVWMHFELLHRAEQASDDDALPDHVGLPSLDFFCAT